MRGRSRGPQTIAHPRRSRPPQTIGETAYRGMAGRPPHGRLAGVDDDRWGAFEAEMARRNAYGVHPEAKTRALAPMSQAAQDAAENLLDKAINGLLSGDSERAEKFIARAAAIPFDEHEQVWPGPMMADQMLHGFLSDFVEDWADAQEHPEDYELVMWLHDDIARVVDQLDSDEGSYLREMIETMVSDAPVLGIHPREARGLANVVKALPDPGLASPGLTLPRDTDASRREEVIRLHLSVTVKVLEAMQEGDAERAAHLDGME